MINELDEIARTYGTDKNMIPGNHGYTEFYDFHFRPLRNKTMTVMEIGVWMGQSLMMWADYFPNSKIIGLDDFSSSQQIRTTYDNPNILFRNGSQVDDNTINSIINEFKQFDIIIDDGSHYSPHQIYTFQKMWNIIKPGGWYVIEDLNTSYPPFITDFKPRFNPNNLTAVDYFKTLLDPIILANTDLKEMHIHKEVIFFRKR